MARTKAVSTTLLRLALGAFFIVLGILNLSQTMNEGIFSLTPRDNLQWLEIGFGVVELICGAFFVASAFLYLAEKTMYRSTLVILISWLTYLVLQRFFLGNFFLPEGARFVWATFGNWILILFNELVIAAVLGVMLKAFKD